MKLFCYSATATRAERFQAADDGSFVLPSVVKELERFAEIHILRSDAIFHPSPGGELRNGDFLLLHISQQEELEALLDKRTLLEQYRILLVLDADLYLRSTKYHLLNPRFIMTTEQHVNILTEVVANISNKMAAQRQAGPYGQRSIS